MLTLENLSLRRQRRLCLEQVSLRLAPGEVLALAGPNGAGKSTLLKLACAEWQPSAGRALLAGEPVARMSPQQRARRMAVLRQETQLDFAFRVDEVVALGRMPHASGRQRDREIVEAAMALTGVGALAGALYPQLSGGEQRRVQLARVLAQIWPEADGPPERVLLLDEPTAALDWAHQLELLQNLRRLAARGLAVLVVLHDLNLALRYADSVALLQQGRLAALGPAAQVLRPDAIRTVFGVEVQVQPHPVDGRPVIIQ